MSIYTMIMEDLQRARVARDAQLTALLSSLIGDLQRIDPRAESVGEQQVIALVKKYRENAAETKSRDGILPETVELCEFEMKTLEKYLPKQLSDSELMSIVVDFCSTQPTANLGLVMKHLNKSHGGTFNGKSAKDIVERILKDQ